MRERSNVMASSEENTKINLSGCVGRGQWWEVMKIYKKYPESHEVIVSKYGETALHVAISNEVEFYIKELVSIARVKALAIGNDRGYTPLHLAASLGNSSICKCIAEKDSNLIGARNDEGETPLFVAVCHGWTNTFLYLHHLCRKEGYRYGYDRRNNGDTILHSAISEQHFDLAYIIILEYPKLVHQVNVDGISPLHLLATKPSVFESGIHLFGIRKLVYNCISVRKLARIYDSVKVANPKWLSSWADMHDGTALASVPNHVLCPPNYATCFNFFTLLWNIIRPLGENLYLCLSPVGRRKNHQQDEEAANEQVDHSENHQEDEETTNRQGDRQENQQEEAANEQGNQRPISETVVDHRKNYQEDEAAANVQEREDRMTFIGEGRCWTYIKYMIFACLLFPAGCVYFPVVLIFNLMTYVFKLVMYFVGYGNYEHLKNIKERCGWSVEVMDKLLKCNSEYACEQQGMRPEPPIDQEYQYLADLSPIATTTKMVETPLLIAAKHGVVEMVEVILDDYPNAIFDVNAEKKNIVMLAVEHRQPHLYAFLLDDWRKMKAIFAHVDKDGNSVLHIAAKLGDGQRPWRIRGAALQMHMEVKWYKFVKHSMPPRFFARYNNGHRSPKEIFQETHKNLIEEARQWLTSTSQSCSLVAALIATVAFATSATVPGGVKQDNGAPTLEHKPIFIVSAGSSLIALCFSMISVVMFLGILTSNFKLKDFRWELPNKLLLGLISLLISIVSMLLSFFAGHHFVLKEELKHRATLVYAFLCLPFVVFIISKFPLDFEIVWTTLNKKPRK